MVLLLQETEYKIQGEQNSNSKLFLVLVYFLYLISL